KLRAPAALRTSALLARDSGAPGWDNVYGGGTLYLQRVYLAIPTLTSPAPDAQITTLNPTLAWKLLRYADRYDLQLWPQPNPSSVLERRTALDSIYIRQALTPATTYN